MSSKKVKWPLEWHMPQLVEDIDMAPLVLRNASDALLMLLRHHHGEAGRPEIPLALLRNKHR